MSLGRGVLKGSLGRRDRARLRVVVALTLALAAVVIALVHQDAGRSSVAEAFVGDFEVSPPGWQQFDGLGYEEDRPLAESFALVDSPVRQGQRAVRVTVRQGYSRFGHNEATMLNWDGGERDGDEYWYAWSTLFPREWTAPEGWGIFAEWHPNLPTSPIIAFSARGNRASFMILSGLTDEVGNTAAVDRVVPLLSTLSKGRWNDFVMHVRWSAHDEGVVEVYHRVEGARSLRKLVSFTNVPTFQVTKDGRGFGTYLLLGMYRASYCPQPTQLECTTPRGVQPPSVVYHDGFVREHSFESAVAQAFPGQPPALPSADSRAVQQEGSRLTPVGVRRAPRPAKVESDSGCRGCRAIATDGRIVATIAGAADDRDTAVFTYRIRQRTAIVVRHRLGVAAPRKLTGALVVMQLQRQPGGRVLADLYVGAGGTLRLSSPPGALRPQGFDVDTGVAAGPSAEPRTVELRLTRNTLLLGVDGRLVVRLANLEGPRRNTPVSARIGIDRYNGQANGGPIRAAFDELVVGTS